MKKLFALMLCLALALSSAALAETAEKKLMGTLSINGAFELRCALPEGYELTVLDYDETHCLATLTADETRPVMLISIAYDELLSEVERLNDLDEEALEKIAATFREEDVVDISYMETAYGTKLMVIKENKDAVDYVDIYSIYKGCEVEFVLLLDLEQAEEGLTDDQINAAVKFLSDLDFVPIG